MTAAASDGAPLARRECDRAAEMLGTGIRLVGGCFAGDAVSVALIGGMVRSPYMQDAMERALGKSTGKRYDIKEYNIVEPVACGEAGAARMALG